MIWYLSISATSSALLQLLVIFLTWWLDLKYKMSFPTTIPNNLHTWTCFHPEDSTSSWNFLRYRWLNKMPYFFKEAPLGPQVDSQVNAHLQPCLPVLDWLFLKRLTPSFPERYPPTFRFHVLFRWGSMWYSYWHRDASMTQSYLVCECWNEDSQSFLSTLEMRPRIWVYQVSWSFLKIVNTP